jgi:aminopeptidase N
MGVADPTAIHRARQFLREGLARALKAEWLAAYEANATPGEYSPDADSMANARCATCARLSGRQRRRRHAGTGGPPLPAERQHDRPLRRAVCAGQQLRAGPRHALADFYERFEDDALVIDKWFSLQGMQRGDPHAGKRTMIPCAR